MLDMYWGRWLAREGRVQNIGIDIIEIARIEQVIAHWGEYFLHRVYTSAELSLYHKKVSSLAARFAGKEAVIKALGARDYGIGWRDIEILSNSSGKPLVCLHGKAQSQADSLGLGGFGISLSHSKDYAIAFVVGEAG